MTRNQCRLRQLLSNSFFAFGVMLAPTPIDAEHSLVKSESEEVFVVWNVGQGLWTTLVESSACLHFDAGGEQPPWRQIENLCLGKRNVFSFSHWDWDHICFAARAAARLKRSCLLNAPWGASSLKKQNLLARLAPCEKKASRGEFQEIAVGTDRKLRRRISTPVSANDLSRIYAIDGQILAPGDSSKTEERIWAESLHSIEKSLRLLILGHHGSRTSTSTTLLRHLPYVHQAIASARKARYGHPHREVVQRLREVGIAVLSTDDWGSIKWSPQIYESQSSIASPIGDTADTPCSSCERPVHK